MASSFLFEYHAWIMKKVGPKNVKTAVLHGLMLGAIAPRPIAFASTIDNEGNPNLSPFSFFNAFSVNPPTLIFSPARRVRDNTIKHTLENVYETMEVVINVVSYEMVQQMSLSSTEYPKEVNEFEKAGFTAVPSEMVKPFRVKESPVQFECKVNKVIELGNEGGAGNLIICEILLMHINEDILDENGRINPYKIDLVSRMGGNWYCRANGDALFEVEKPTDKMGMGIDQLPERIRNSKILSGNDLGKLGNVEIIPSEEEVETFRQEHTAQQLLGNMSDINEENIHQFAKELLDKGNIEDAWKILLIKTS